MGPEEGVGVPQRFLGGTLDEVTYLSMPSSSNGKEGLVVSFPILLVIIEEAFHVGLGDIC
jgi:hypothetical protein